MLSLKLWTTVFDIGTMSGHAALNPWSSPAHLVLLTRGGPGGPVPPSPGRVSSTLMWYSVSGSRCHSLYVTMFTPCTSDHGDWLARYSISFLMMGPSPRMELVLSWMIR